MTLSGVGGGCRDDIIVHSSCDVSCDMNWPMDFGDTHSLASGVPLVHSPCEHIRRSQPPLNSLYHCSSLLCFPLFSVLCCIYVHTYTYYAYALCMYIMHDWLT